MQTLVEFLLTPCVVGPPICAAPVSRRVLQFHAAGDGVFQLSNNRGKYKCNKEIDANDYERCGGVEMSKKKRKKKEKGGDVRVAGARE
jgi:hypothetical protein